MANKKGGFMNRLIMGKERAEGYARSTLPTNRWSLFWDIFKGRFSKLFFVNIMIFVFFIPLLFVLVMRSAFLTSCGLQYPFSQGLAIGYPSFPNLTGYQERIILQGNLVYYGLFMPVASLIASIGIAGGAYVIRNMVWTEGIFVTNDFWHGIKVNVKLIMPTALFMSIVFFLGSYSLSASELSEAIMGGTNFWLVLSRVAVYVILGFSMIMCLYMVTMAVTYELKLRHLIKNAFILTISLLPFNVFFLLLTAIPLMFLLMGGLFKLIGYMMFFSLSLSLMLLIWTDYSHWVFDKYINDKIPGAKKNRGIYEKQRTYKSEALEQYAAQKSAFAAKSYLDGRPIKPIDDEEIQLAELPQMYTREDLERLQQSKEEMYRDNEEYIKAHSKDNQSDEKVQAIKDELVKKYGVSKEEADALAQGTKTIVSSDKKDK